MKFREKNDGGVELHLSAGERELVCRALRYYSAYCESDDEYIDSQIMTICEIMNVLDS